MEFLLTAAVAGAGAFLFYKMRVPAGALIGALIFCSVFHVVTGVGNSPVYLKTAVQAIAGGFIGQRIRKQDLTELRNIFGAGLLMLAGMILYTFVTGRILTAVSNLDPATALTCAMPAGLSDTAIISADIGADPAQCTAVSMVRTLFSLTVLPQLAFRVCERRNGGKTPPVQKKADVRSKEQRGLQRRAGRSGQTKDSAGKKLRLENILLTAILAEGAGILGKWSGIPAGAMTFAVFAVAFLNIETGRAALPKGLRLTAQCLTGMIVGVKVTMEDVENIRTLLIPALILILSLVICNYVCGFLLHRICRLDLSTSLFGSIPAGVSDMALIAADLGGDSPRVAVLQLVRYVGLISIMPSLIRFFVLQM